MLEDQELELAKERLPVFKAAAEAYQWPQEIIDAVTADLGLVALASAPADFMTWVLMAIDSRESRFGLLLDGDGLGDAGHGHGEIQIDDRSHATFCDSGQWRDLAASLDYVRKNVVIPSYNYLAQRFGLFGSDFTRLFWGTVGAYNCGAGNVSRALQEGFDVDARTTGHNYSADVRARALAFMQALS